MVAGSSGISVTFWAEIYVPPAGKAVMVGGVVSAGAELTVMERLLLKTKKPVSVTLTVKLLAPTAADTPEIMPVEGFNVSPEGRLPEGMLQV